MYSSRQSALVIEPFDSAKGNYDINALTTLAVAINCTGEGREEFLTAESAEGTEGRVREENLNELTYWATSSSPKKPSHSSPLCALCALCGKNLLRSISPQ